VRNWDLDAEGLQDALLMVAHAQLRGLGVELIPASAPSFFIEDTPTARMVRQILGAVAEFEKASLVAKLKAARDRKRQRTGKAEGRKSHAEMNPQLVALAKRLWRKRRNGAQPSLRDVSAELAQRGHLNANGSPYSACSIASMVAPGGPPPRARRQSTSSESTASNCQKTCFLMGGGGGVPPTIGSG
jgi:hypothetical protein